MSTTPPTTPRRRARRRWLAAAAVILLPSVLLRACVVTTYAIRSPSMVPTLEVGDHLVVLREGVDPRALARWDVALFDRSIDTEVPAGIDAVAKRIVGLPGEWIEIRGGDIFTGPTEDDLSLERKPDALVEGLLVPSHEGWSAWSGVGLEPGVDGARLGSPDGTAWAILETNVRDGLGDGSGATPVRDTALEIEVAEGNGILLLQLREGADTFQARLAPAERGGAVLHHNLGGGSVATEPGFEGLAAGQRVLFWNVDNGVRLWVDGRLLLGYDYAENAIQTPGAGLNNVPRVGVADGERHLPEVTVLRDLHYGGLGDYGARPGIAPYPVPVGSVFLLGDHSRESRDSRHFGAVELEALLGRPFATYRPLDRARWLSAAGLGR